MSIGIVASWSCASNHQHPHHQHPHHQHHQHHQHQHQHQHQHHRHHRHHHRGYCSIIAAGDGHETRADSSRGRLMVYVGSLPLRAPPGFAQRALSLAESLSPPSATAAPRHFYTILASSSDDDADSYVAFDFQPRNPEDLYTALVALSGGSIPGVVLERKMSGLPTKRCWKVGPTRKSITMEDALHFNEQWKTDIRLWKHDCRHHTNEFVEFLTGEKNILEKLSEGNR